VDSRSIDKIVAEGDYMKVHVADWNCMVHDTMEHMAARLEGCGFVRLHWSWLVRTDFIDRLFHSEHRWVARLLDGTQVRIAKAHVKEVLHILSGESSTTKGGLATTFQPTDDNGVVPERLMHVKH
jgi:DNA-binding LytR/AlgR family response regulator